MRILYLNPAQAFGGSSKSLIELFNKIKKQEHTGLVICPAGTASEQFQRAGLNAINTFGLPQFDGTRFGYYRGLRWFILIREFFFLPFSFFHLLKARQLKPKFDLIHVNEANLLFLGIFAKWVFKLPLLVHVRSVQLAGNYWRTHLFSYLLRKYADEVICIDETVRQSLRQDLSCVVIRNGISHVNIQPKSELKDVKNLVRVGFLGVLLPLKGIYELIEAMRILKERGVRVECLVAGENPRRMAGIKGYLLSRLGFAHDVRAEVDAMIEAYGLHDHVKMLGFVDDVQALYRKIDILCFPSHLNAAGRPVFEAAFHSVPSVVALENPLPDAIVHGVTGLAVPRPDPEMIADAIQKLAEDAEYRCTLGRQARVWAEENFSIERSAEQMLEIYRRVLNKSTPKAKG
jgi:glycosyltransferase involved in cell wall biosynthesis